MENNSQHQVNESYSAYRDRRDVDKAWDDFLPPWDKPYEWMTVSDCKAFARYFAQRVKGGKL